MKNKQNINLENIIAEKYYEMTKEYHTEKGFLNRINMTKEEFLNKKEDVVDIMERWVEEEMVSLFDRLDNYNLEKYLLKRKEDKKMKTLQELNKIIEQNTGSLLQDIFEYAYENENIDIYLYIDIVTGETRITGCPDKTSNTEIFVDYFIGFDRFEILNDYMCWLNEEEVVKIYGLEKEYEEAKEDLETGNYAFGDFLCENGILHEVEEAAMDELFDERFIEIKPITEINYLETVNKLEVR